MKRHYKRVENWLWIIVLISALLYFHWLVDSFHTENKELKQAQKEFSQEIEEKYQTSRELQNKIQAQLNQITKGLLEFLQIQQASNSIP